MNASQQRIRRLVRSLLIIGLLLPLAWYGIEFAFVPTLAPAQAIERLQSTPAGAVLVDVRPADLFEKQHVRGAESHPLSEIHNWDSPGSVPSGWQGKMLLVMSSGDLSSVAAIRHLKALSQAEVYHIRGGLQAWIAALGRFDQDANSAFVTMNGDPALRPISMIKQWMAVLSGFVIKPTYMIMALLLGLGLWSARSPDLSALRWSMLAFFTGEAWCAVNYLVFNDTSYLSEYLHSYGMVVGFGFAFYALIEGLDARVLHLSAQGQRCAALELCGPCIKYEEVDCGARKIFLLLLPALAIVTIVPLLAAFNTVSYNAIIWNTPYNYSHALIYQVFEWRYCPAAALTLFAAAFILLWRQPRRPLSPYLTVLTAAGLGAFGFAVFRLGLGKAFAGEVFWSNFWEETTELVFLVAAYGLMLFFPRTFLAEVTGQWPWMLVPPARLPAALRSNDIATSNTVTIAPAAQRRPIALVACRVLEDLFARQMPQELLSQTIFLEYGLHSRPSQLKQAIQAALDGLPEPSLVILGYGLCGNSLRDISAGRHILVLPRVDSCIPLLLGSWDAYREQMMTEPATFYLSKGWLEAGDHPLKNYQQYVSRFGVDDAEMLVDMQYRHCRRLALVASSRAELASCRGQAMDVARFCERWGTRYEELLGDDAYVRRLVEVALETDHTGDDFIRVAPGDNIAVEQFARL